METTTKQKLLHSSLYPIICRAANVAGLKIHTSRGGGNLININRRQTLFRRSRLTVRGRNNRISIAPGGRHRNLTIEVAGQNNEIRFEAGVMVYERLYISIKGDNCRLRIGRDTTIGGAGIFLEESNTAIEIGRDCMFGRNISLATTDFHSITDLEGRRTNPPADILIGDHVWIGYGADMEKGVSIARDSIVAAHAVVTKQFSRPNVIIGGLPARIIKENINWDRNRI